MSAQYSLLALICLSTFHGYAQEPSNTGQVRGKGWKVNLEFPEVVTEDTRDPSGATTNFTSSPFWAFLVYDTPFIEGREHTSAMAIGGGGLFAASALPTKSGYDLIMNDLLKKNDVKFIQGVGKNSGLRSLSAGSVTGAGLLTLAVGGSNIFKIDFSSPTTNRFQNLKEDKLYQALKEEFGEENAQNIILKRFVEGWSCKAIAQAYYGSSKERFLEILAEETKKLKPGILAMSVSKHEQDTLLDQRACQITALRMAMEADGNIEKKKEIFTLISLIRNGSSSSESGDGSSRHSEGQKSH